MLVVEPVCSVKHALQNIKNDCHQWLSDSSRVHQIRFRPGLRPGPRWGSSPLSPRPPSRLGRGYPLPIPHPLDAFGVSVSSPTATRPRAFGARSSTPPSSLNSPPPMLGGLDKTLPLPCTWCSTFPPSTTTIRRSTCFALLIR